MSETITHPALTGRRALSLAAVVDAAVRSAKVRRLIPEGAPGEGLVVEGVARSIGDKQGCFAGADDDIRDEYLRVTMTSGLGFDVYWPVAVLVEEHLHGTFVVDED